MGSKITSTIVYKWKNHFYKMKADVGMSGHEKERKQEDAYIHQDTNSFITPSLHLCSALKFCLFVVNALGKEKTSLHRINYMKNIINLKEAKM